MTTAVRTSRRCRQVLSGARWRIGCAMFRVYTSAGETQAETGRIAAIGCVAPHAGYVYSGSVAGAVYSRLEIPERCVILCPNHTGKGRRLAVMTDSAWQTPLGEVRRRTRSWALVYCAASRRSKRTARRIAANMPSKFSCLSCRRNKRS